MMWLPIFATCLVHVRAGLVNSAADTPLNEWPMLMTHDAATGYLTNELNPIYAWTRTQPADSSGFTKQLECGARAFDFRANVDKKGALVFHHGSVAVEKDASAALAEIVAWAGKNTDMEDLVMLSNWDCTGDGCNTKLQAAFAEHKLHVVSSCAALANLTLSSASVLGALPGGGSVLVAPDCSKGGGYDPNNACSGFDGPSHLLRDSLQADDDCFRLPANSTFEEQQECGQKWQGQLPDQSANGLIPGYYDCWVGATNRDFAVDRIVNFLGNFTVAAPTPGQFIQVQALWQESVPSVVIGVAHISSLLHDEEKSQLNALMVDKINSDAFKHISFFEVNNVCNHGPELKQALRAYHDRRKTRNVKTEAVLV